ncbi:MAG: PAS domain-containing protein, partial [Saprospiraceae bacterium]
MPHSRLENSVRASKFDLTAGLRAVNRAVQIINRGRDPASDLREAVQAAAAGLDYDYFGYASLTERSGGMIELGSGNSVVMRGSSQVTDFSFLAGTTYPYREVGFEWLRTLVEEKIYSGVMSDLPELIVETLRFIDCEPSTYVLVPLTSDNQLMGALAIGCDDSDYKWEENELLVLESFAAALAGILSAGREKKLREAALNTTPDLVAVVTAHSGQLRFVNKRQFIGVSLMDEFRIPIMECFDDYVGQEDKRAMARVFRPLFRRNSGDLVVEYTFTAKLPNGSTHHLFTRGRALDRRKNGVIETYLLTVQDVTEDIRMRTQLKKEQERYASFVKYSQEGIYYVAMNKPVPLVDLPGRDIDWMYNNSHLADCNQAMADLMGSNKRELIGMPTAMIHPVEDRYNRDRFAKILDSNNLTLSQVESIMEVRGEIRHVVSNVVAIVDDRNLIGVWGTLRDVTEQRLVENELLERDMLLQTVITQAEINVWDWYPTSGEIKFLNDWNRIVFGPIPQEVNFNYFYDQVHMEDRSLLMGPYLQAHANPAIRYYKAEFRLRHLDGSYRWTQHRGHIISRTESGL